MAWIGDDFAWRFWWQSLFYGWTEADFRGL